MADKVLVDALPYIDQGYDEPGVREAALAMVEDECRRYRPTKNYLEYLPPLNMTAFETPMMLAEFERISNRVPMEPLSMKRYELPPPAPGKTTDEPAWQESVANSKAQLEHQSVRALNLELMLEYGCEAWKAHLGIFTALQAKAQRVQLDLKKDIQEANWQRKAKQTATGEKLRSLEAQWVGLVSKNYEIEQACAKLEEIGVAYKGQLGQLEAEKRNEECEMEERTGKRSADAKDQQEAVADAREETSGESNGSEAATTTRPADDDDSEEDATAAEVGQTDAAASTESVPDQTGAESRVHDEDVEMKDVENNEAVGEET